MNYYSVIKRVQRVLKRPVSATWSDLTSEENLNIKSLVNQVNKDVLLAFNYPCRERKTTFSVTASTTSFANSINGEIYKLYNATTGQDYHFEPDVSKFEKATANAYAYGLRNNKILFDSHDTTTSLTVEYYTYNLALANTAWESFVEGTTTESSELSNETDYSIIPSDLHEPILVYGTCYYLEQQKNESPRIASFKQRFDAGLMQLNAYNRSEEQELSLTFGDINYDLRRSSV
jgi:hypothetical protein